MGHRASNLVQSHKYSIYINEPCIGIKNPYFTE